MFIIILGQTSSSYILTSTNIMKKSGGTCTEVCSTTFNTVLLIYGTQVLISVRTHTRPSAVPRSCRWHAAQRTEKQWRPESNPRQRKNTSPLLLHDGLGGFRKADGVPINSPWVRPSWHRRRQTEMDTATQNPPFRMFPFFPVFSYTRLLSDFTSNEYNQSHLQAKWQNPRPLSLSLSC